MTDKVRIVVVPTQGPPWVEEWPMPKNDWGAEFEMAERRFHELVGANDFEFVMIQTMTYVTPRWTEHNSYRRGAQ